MAPEINTPLSYISNNLVVLERDVKGLMALLDVYENARADLAGVNPAAAEHAAALAEDMDLAYIRDNTPTFTQEQAKIAKTTLQRIQTNATPPEIWSGRGLNILLKDLVKWAGKKSPVPTKSIDEDVLKHLNIATKYGNLGLLRNNGQFTWPAALRALIPQEDRANLANETQRLFRQAANAQVDAGAPLLSVERTGDDVGTTAAERVTLPASEDTCAPDPGDRALSLLAALRALITGYDVSAR